MVSVSSLNGQQIFKVWKSQVISEYVLEMCFIKCASLFPPNANSSQQVGLVDVQEPNSDDNVVFNDPYLETLQKVFNFNHFKPGQDVIRLVMSDKDGLCMMATGSGKNSVFCFAGTSQQWLYCNNITNTLFSE